MTTYLDNLTAQQEKTQRANLERYEQILKEIADGNEPDPADVEAICAAAGKTIGDVKAGVRLFGVCSTHRNKITEADEYRETFKAAMAERKKLVDEDLVAAHQAIKDIHAEIAKRDQVQQRHHRLQTEKQNAEGELGRLVREHPFLKEAAA